MEWPFRVLGVDVVLSGPEQQLEPIAVAYRRFLISEPGTDPVRIELEPAADRMTLDGKSVSLLPELETVLQVYQLFLSLLMDRIESHAILHAAALVDPSGRALVLAAPSGHGKSSLSLELAHRGFGFLGDDFAPLDLNERTIAPYPRAVGLLPDGTAPIPGPFREALHRPDPVRLFGKILLDVGDVLGERALVGSPAKLGNIVVLSGTAPSGELPVTWIDVVARAEEAAGLEQDFAATPGLDIVTRQGSPALHHWKLRLRHELHPTRAVSRILDSSRVLFVEKSWDPKPSFTGEPVVTRISRREAAEMLGRELLNRRAGGRLLARYGGSLPALFIDLAGTLRESTCWRVTMGPYERTADVIQQLVAQTS